MRSYFKRLDTRGHFGDFWHKAKTQREDKKICARMERRRLNMNNPNIDYDAYALRMEPTIYLPMKPGETKTEAEDRLLETLENAGIILSGWKRSSVYYCKASEDSNFNYCPHCGAKMVLDVTPKLAFCMNCGRRVLCHE